MPDYQHIFLISHMRANSSLISHILGSHPQINGYYEMHLSYQAQDDLAKQRQQYAQKDTIKPALSGLKNYFFDKLLHNQYQLSTANFTSNKHKILVTIRPPEQSIKSIINLFQKKEGDHPYAKAELAMDYYIQRLQAMAQFCQQNKHAYYYYDANLIRHQPQKLLTQLQNYLELSTPLNEDYQCFSLTGKAGAGDSSDNMRTGRIIKQQTNYHNIKLSNKQLDAIKRKAEHYRQHIITHADAYLI